MIFLECYDRRQTADMQGYSKTGVNFSQSETLSLGRSSNIFKTVLRREPIKTLKADYSTRVKTSLCLPIQTHIVNLNKI